MTAQQPPTAAPVHWLGMILPLAIVAFLLVAIVRSPQRISYDAALYLQCGQLITEGQRPYVDFIDTNPPLIMYLSVIPVIAAHWLPLHIIAVFSLLVLALSLWSVSAVRGELRAVLGADDAVPRVAAVLWAAFTLLLWHLEEYGQREHLFVLLYMPLLFMRWRRCEHHAVGARHAVILGIAAGIGLCLKPHFFLPAAASEVWLRRSRREAWRVRTPELYALLVICALYALHWLLLPGDVRAGFLRLGTMLLQGYGVYDAAWRGMLDPTFLVTGLVVTLSIALGRVAPRHAALHGMMAAFAVGALAAYVGQGKGWFYHQIPAVGAAALLVGVVGFSLLHGRRRAVAEAAAVTLGVGWLIAVLYTVTPDLGRIDMGAYWSRPLIPVINAYSREREPVLIVSTAVQPAYPLLLQTNRRPASRYLWMFPIPFLYRGVDMHVRSAGSPYRSTNDPPPAETRFLNELSEDIERARPPLVLIYSEEECQGCPAGFNLRDYLAVSGILSTLQKGYRMVGNVESLDVLVRIDRLGLLPGIESRHPAGAPCLRGRQAWERAPRVL